MADLREKTTVDFKINHRRRPGVCLFSEQLRSAVHSRSRDQTVVPLLGDVVKRRRTLSFLLSPGLLIQIWRAAFSLFPAFDFVFPFPHTARFPFSPGKRETVSSNFQKNAVFQWENPETF